MITKLWEGSFADSWVSSEIGSIDYDVFEKKNQKLKKNKIKINLILNREMCARNATG